jgi:hypothetical protein
MSTKKVAVKKETKKVAVKKAVPAKKTATKAVTKTVAPAKKPAVKKVKQVWPVVTVGSHLTVTKYEDGKTELKWDDVALMRDVQAALASVAPPVQTKKPRKAK